MTTKRSLLMLLVMLMSVAGAWAQEPEEVLLRLTATASNPVGIMGQYCSNAFDGNSRTLWHDLTSNEIYLLFKTDRPQKVDAYYVTLG